MEFCVKLWLLLLMCNASWGAWVKEMENPGFFEGDIVLSPAEREEMQTGKFHYASLKHREKLWPKVNGEAIVPYVTDKSLSYYKRALDELQYAIGQYHKYTCIRFVERTNEKAYVEFFNGRGCSSPLGRQCPDGSCKKHNRVSLAEGCWWRGIIMHEIAHSLGLHHEQTRPDRDQYVKILSENAYPSMVFNFEKQNSSEIDSLGTKYDYLSMMHYGWNAFGRAQKMTIKTLDPRFQYLIGQWEGFSEIDVLQLNKLYRCIGNYPKLPPYVMPPEGCYNLAASCPFRTYHNYCTNSKWKRFMYKNCKKSCGYCGNGPAPTGKQTVTPTRVTEKLTVTKKPSITYSTGAQLCGNRVRDCSSIGKSKCTDPPSPRWKAYMAKNCKQFCNFC